MIGITQGEPITAERNGNVRPLKLEPDNAGERKP